MSISDKTSITADTYSRKHYGDENNTGIPETFIDQKENKECSSASARCSKSIKLKSTRESAIQVIVNERKKASCVFTNYFHTPCARRYEISRMKLEYPFPIRSYRRKRKREIQFKCFKAIKRLSARLRNKILYLN